MNAPLGGQALRLYSTSVRAEWVDYNDHLSEWAYLLIFGDNADAFFRYIGIDDDYRAAGHSLYTAETHLRHLREVRLGQPLTLTLRVLGQDSKRLHVLHEMHAGELDGIADTPPCISKHSQCVMRTIVRITHCVATAEQMLLHVDTSTGRVAPFGAGLAERLRALAVSHSALPVPDYVGRPIRSLAGA